MNVKKLTQASILSSLFVVINIIAVSIGLNYFGYIDFMVPVLTVILYLKCGFKYAVLSSITSIILTIFALGNLPLGILMIQSMILGIITAAFMSRSLNILDDIFFSALLSCFLVIIFDINFAGLIGYSLINESRDMLDMLPFVYKEYSDFVFIGSIASIPFGTVMITYVLSAVLSRKLKIQNENAGRKSFLICNFKKFGQFISCSKSTLIFGVIYVVTFEAVKNMSIINDFEYAKVLFSSMEYIIIFFIIQDSFSTINKVIYGITKSRASLLISEFLIIYMLLGAFKFTAVLLIIASYLAEKKYNIKRNQSMVLKKYFAGLKEQI